MNTKDRLTEEEVDVLSVAEAEAWKQKILERVGLTEAELNEQADTGYFKTDATRHAWLIVSAIRGDDI